LPNTVYGVRPARTRESGLPSHDEKGGFRDLRVIASPKRSSKTKTMLLACLVVCFNSVGNLALAWGLKATEMVAWNPASYVRAMVNPFVAAGIVLLILWMLTRMALMSWADLSFTLPLMAVGYIVAAVLGKFVLHEVVTVRQWIGTAFIFGGIALVGSTTHRTHTEELQRS
jgi:drug/metabolite transporter (DMT)-like permease